MDAIAFSSAPNPNHTHFFSSTPPSNAQCFSICSPRRRRPLPALRSQPSAASHHDVVVVGAGIVGLSIARHLLPHTPLSIAIADAAAPCSGATGAAQGRGTYGCRTGRPGVTHGSWRCGASSCGRNSRQRWTASGAAVRGRGWGPGVDEDRKLISWKNYRRAGYIGGKDQGSVSGRHTCGMLVCIVIACIRASTLCWK